MSRPFAAVIAITLGLPVLAMIALTATGGVKAGLLLTLLLGGVLMGFLVAGIFEIRRLIEVDDGEDSEHDESGAESSTEAELDFLPFEIEGEAGRRGGEANRRAQRRHRRDRSGRPCGRRERGRSHARSRPGARRRGDGRCTGAAVAPQAQERRTA